MTAGILLAAPESGSGKTTVTAGIVAALKARGLVVQPFKVGPDYIDPTYHTLAAGRTCRNLDTWMLGRAAVRESFARNTRDCDIAVVEGVMGLFDGFGVLDNEGSSADVAQLLNLPIILVMNARGMARSAAAIVKGYDTFSSDIRIAGVILNRVGSARHAALCTQAIEHETGIPVLGYLLRDRALTMPERHLGLVPTAEEGEWEQFINEMRERVEATVDLGRLVEIAQGRRQREEIVNVQLPGVNCQLEESGVRIAVAEDEAFSFTYPENVELLREAGAEIVPFSPLHDGQVPENVQGIILSGGFPELYASVLSQNRPMLASLRAAHEGGCTIYAECGGLMALTEAIVDQQGQRHIMVGILPGESRMTGRVTLGYRHVTALDDSPLLAAGESVRGHEFHYSTWDTAASGLEAAYQIEPRSRTGGSARPTGVQVGNVWASYIHVHFLAKPEMATRFVQWCREQSNSQKTLDLVPTLCVGTRQAKQTQMPLGNEQ